jgi:drug/metabolite transporter (DMT)-like permease
MDWLPITLLCAFLVASADAATKKLLTTHTALELTVIRFCWSAVLCLPLLLLQRFPALPAAFWGWVAVLLPFEILAMWLYMQAIRSSPLAHTLPYLAFTPIFNVLTAFLILDEAVSPRGFSGILVIAAGAYVLNLNASTRPGWLGVLDPFASMLKERGPRLMLMVAILYSITSTLGKGALQYAPPLFFGPLYFCVLAVVTFVWIVLSERSNPVPLLWRQPRAHLIVGLLTGAMAVTHFIALARVEVAYMIAVKRSSLLFGILYGAWLFREPHLRQHLAGGALMLLGIALIVL